MDELTEVLLIGLITVALIATMEGTILYFLLGVRKTTAPLYPITGTMGVLSTREAVLIGRFLRRQVRGDGVSMGILQREEQRIREGLEPEVPD